MGPKMPIRLVVEQLENRDTPSISLVGVPGAAHAPAPLAFLGFDNPADGEFHPNFSRSPTAIAATGATAGQNPTVQNPDFGNEGPWSAHYVSPVISCTIEADCPMDPTPYVPHP
ncbi:MAG: hypothetical protein L0Z62_31375 [Gemmataceae bacterium]|nr:hypothetical protein [Gemmataceae bacterium]